MLDVVIPRLTFDDFVRGVQIECSQRNIRLVEGALRVLFGLAGGRIGPANKILNSSVEVILASPLGTSPWRRMSGHPMNMLRIVMVRPRDVRRGAMRLVMGGEFSVRTDRLFTYTEFSILRELALSPKSQSDLVEALKERKHDMQSAMRAIGDLRNADLIDSDGGRYFVSVGLYEVWAKMQPEGAHDASRPEASFLLTAERTQTKVPGDLPVATNGLGSRMDAVAEVVQRGTSQTAGPPVCPEDCEVPGQPNEGLPTKSMGPLLTGERRRFLRGTLRMRVGLTDGYGVKLRETVASPHERLCDLLRQSYNEVELRRFVDGIPMAPGASKRSGSLPGPAASFAALVEESALLLEREGVLRVAFDKLRLERPNRVSQIEDVELAFARAAGPEELPSADSLGDY